MPSEKLPNAGVNQGESQEKSPERARLEQELGRQAVKAAMESGDFAQIPIDDLQIIFPIREGETKEEHIARVQLIQLGKIPAPQVIEIGGGKYQEIPADKYGNGITDESLEHLMGLPPEQRKQELARTNENFRLALEQSRNQGYEQAQQELAEVLAGKAPAERLKEMQPNLAALQAEVERLDAVVYTDEELKAWQQRQLAEAQRELDNYQKKYQMVANLVPGGAEAEADDDDAESASEGDTSAEQEPGDKEVDTRATMLETNEPTGNLMLANLDGLKGILSPGEYRKLKQRIAKRQKNKPEEMRFAEGQEGEPTDEEVAKAAEAAANNRSRMWTAEGYRETTDADDEKNRRAYRRGWNELVKESEAGRFDAAEAKISAEEKRAELLQRAMRGVKERPAFKRRLQAAVIGLVALAVMPVAIKANAYAQDKTLVPVQPQSIEEQSGEAFEDADEEAVDAAIRVAVDRSISIQDIPDLAEYKTDEDRINALWSVGNDAYERFMEDENSQMMENGLRANYTEYQSPDKHSKNSYGTNKVDAYGSEKLTREGMLEMVKAQPQAMASFMATYPTMLKQCGVGEEVINIENVEKRANAVMDLLLGERGGDLQNVFMGAITQALSDEKTEYNFYQEYGNERTFYMKQLDPNQPDRPDNIVLKTDIKQRHGEKQVQITIIYPDGTVEIGDFNLACGFQTNLDVVTYEVRTEITKAVDLVIQEETPPEVSVVEETPTETPSEETPPPETDNGDDGEDDDGDDEEDDDDDDDDDEKEKPEEKDTDKEQEVVDDGEQTDPVDETEQTGEKTEEDDYGDDAQTETEQGTQPDQNASTEEQQQAHEEQEKANEEEKTENISDGDFEDFVEKILNGG